MDDRAFWETKGMENIIPEGFGEFPEGWDVSGLLKEITDELGYSSVIDFGCGYGRLCKGFDPSKYMGLDINPEALGAAKKRFQDYQFHFADEEPKYADIYLAYTVFLHMKEQELHEVLKSMRCKWLIVAEILGREWRRDGLPPVYNRELCEYVEIMRRHDFVLHKHLKRPYKRYADAPWYQGRNTDISFLVFRKCLKNPLT